MWQPVAAQDDARAPGAETSLERMLGAMLMCGFRGAELSPDDPFLAAVKSGRVGNVILFDRDVSTGAERNIRSPEQVRRLTGTLRAAAPGPMFIAVDQEGGQVRRLKPQKGFLDLPAAQRLGQGSIPETRQTAERLGEELKGLGIDVDLAPVADVDSNPLNPAIGRLGRAFSSDPALVASHALAFGQGLAAAGVAPVLKHFPGQGCAKEDSHLGLTDISQCWDGATDLLPYAEIFRAGWPGMVMPGHLFHARLDPDYPATRSRMVVTGLLRQGL
ncbi:MAG: glycoside hydrolase family 3 protein, partial [Desulfovibrio sp.]|nr:glycoside hydrolase family 3 protein [Desulfovibrio sp.]